MHGGGIFDNAFDDLEALRPKTLFVSKGNSPFATNKIRDEQLEVTGVGAGGSGGKRLGALEGYGVDGERHYCLFDKSFGLVAAKVAEFIVKEVRGLEESERKFRDIWNRKAKAEKRELDCYLVKTIMDFDPVAAEKEEFGH